MDRVHAYLKRAVSNARVEYESTKEAFESAKLRVYDRGLKHPDPDGRAALHQAEEARTHALGKYQKALLAFNEYVLHVNGDSHKMQ
jgi:hypothetical protein